MKKYNLTEKEVISYFGSDEGCTTYNGVKRRYLVFYNDLDSNYKIPARRRWTLAHELGHILLNHLSISNKTKIFRNNLTDEEYDWMEKEANRFASLLLANPIILYKLQVKNSVDIMKICSLSIEAAAYRFNDYLKWLKNKYINNLDVKIINQFYNFIYKKYCLICGHALISENIKFCPICGSKKLIRGEGMMKYKEGVKLDENNHALICPRCDNEDIQEDALYCPICGGSLIQECANKIDRDYYGNDYVEQESCGCRNMKSNARFCPACGNPTTFFTYNYLEPWEKEFKANTDPDDDVPF